MFLKSFKLFGVFVLLFLTGCGALDGGILDVDVSSGVVVDMDGNPIEGAFVGIDDEVIITNEYGAFSVVDGSEIIVAAQGYEDFKGDLDVEGQIILESKPYQSVLGYVYNENGPIRDAFVIYFDSNSLDAISFTRTYDGFVYLPMIVESDATFLVMSEGYENEVVTLKVDGEDDNFYVEMDKIKQGVDLQGEEDPVSEDDVKYDSLQLYFAAMASANLGLGHYTVPIYPDVNMLNELGVHWQYKLETVFLDDPAIDIKDLHGDTEPILIPNEGGFCEMQTVWAWFCEVDDIDRVNQGIDFEDMKNDLNLRDTCGFEPVDQEFIDEWYKEILGLHSVFDMNFENELGDVDIEKVNENAGVFVFNPVDVPSPFEAASYFKPVSIIEPQLVVTSPLGPVIVEDMGTVNATEKSIRYIKAGVMPSRSDMLDLSLGKVSFENIIPEGGMNFFVPELPDGELVVILDMTESGEIRLTPLTAEKEAEIADVFKEYWVGVETTDENSDDEEDSAKDPDGPYGIIGEPPPKGQTDPPLDPDYEDYLWCMHAVNIKYPEVVSCCLAKYGNPNTNDMSLALADQVMWCMNEDPGYLADAKKCEY